MGPCDFSLSPKLKIPLRRFKSIQNIKENGMCELKALLDLPINNLWMTELFVRKEEGD